MKQDRENPSEKKDAVNDKHFGTGAKEVLCCCFPWERKQQMSLVVEVTEAKT